ncbi:MAG: leucine-rich repeat domain-containing protein [Tannerella sp.]|jgi:hypothetical protein|nr:leucine-rich repeat domain-containing protein [Tannerella sp.]
MKKIISLIFTVLCLCLLVGSAKAQTAADWSEDGIWYKVIGDSKVAVCRNPDGQDYTGTVTIPATVTHESVTYTVTAIGNRAFAYEGDAETVEHVNLPGTIVSFGSCAFQFCSGLKSIVIPNSTVALWDNDFDGTDDDEGATFMGCTGLEEVTIGSGITNMAAPNGLFNPVGSKLRKIICYATTPPAVDWATFLGDVSNVALMVPAESINDYLIDYWWNFASAEQNEGSHGVGIYPIGTCLPPRNLNATMDGIVTWTGDASAYNLIVSRTELDNAALDAYSDLIRVTDTEYDLSRALEAENVPYYVYLQGECGSESKSTWTSTSFYYYSGDLCNYTVSGASLYYLSDPDDNYTEPYKWGYSVPVTLEFWQAGALMATVDGDAAFEGTTVSLIPGITATLEWKGTGTYGDVCDLLIKNEKGETVLSRDNLMDNEPETLTITVNCGDDDDANETLDINNVSVTPTLSDGFVIVKAEAGSIVKVMDLAGRLLKQGTITRSTQEVELNYTNGIYLIIVENGNSRFVQKVILKR